MNLLDRLRAKRVFSRLRKRRGRDGTSDSPPRKPAPKLPPKVINRILTFVCPHTLDDSLNSLGDSPSGEKCPPCSARDLAHCALTCRDWNAVATELLYQNIRIDPIHYCPLEEKLRNARKNKKLRYRTRDPEDDLLYDPKNDAANDNLQLLARTLRDNRRLASLLISLKLARTIRDSVNSDLVRAVGVCNNLRYVDLGGGFFAGQPRYDILRMELWMNCPNLRSMTYCHGSERHFSALSDGKWNSLEILTVNNLNVDAIHFRVVLSHLQSLDTLILDDVPKLNDDVFTSKHGVPCLPPIPDLQLHNLPHLTNDGLVAYLADRRVQKTLRRLTLDNTGVKIPTIHEVLGAATALRYLAIKETVTEPLPLTPPPYLRSRRLEALHFEVKNATQESDTESAPSDSYHTYLRGSIAMRGMPALRALYVRDPSFPEALAGLHVPHSPQPAQQLHRRSYSAEAASEPSRRTSAPPALASELEEPSAWPLPAAPLQWSMFASSTTSESGSGVIWEEDEDGGGEASEEPHALEVYTKGHRHDLWLFATTVAPPAFHTSRLGRRPLSTLSAEWNVHARRSVLVTDGTGGFLAVPGAV